MLPNSTERAITIAGIPQSIIECVKQICVVMLEVSQEGGGSLLSCRTSNPHPLRIFIYSEPAAKSFGARSKRAKEALSLDYGQLLSRFGTADTEFLC